MTRSTTQAARTLFSTAMEQGGYFTAKQAIQAGYGYPHLEYHESAGNFERAGHGLYRLTTLPHTENDEYVRLALWSRDRKDTPQAVVSYETALTLHELSDLLPAAIHLTVPVRFRKAPPVGCVLHKAELSPGDIEERIGFRVTTPLRTLLDAATGGVSQEELQKAVREALSRGLVRKTALDKVAAQPAYERLKPEPVSKPKRR